MQKQQRWTTLVAFGASVLLGPPPAAAQDPVGAPTTEESQAPFTAEELRVRMITIEDYKKLMYVDLRRAVTEQLEIDAVTLANVERAITANAAIWHRVRAVADEASRVEQLDEEDLTVLMRREGATQGLADLDELLASARHAESGGGDPPDLRRSLKEVAIHVAGNRHLAMMLMYNAEEALEEADFWASVSGTVR